MFKSQAYRVQFLEITKQRLSCCAVGSGHNLKTWAAYLKSSALCMEQKKWWLISEL